MDADDRLDILNVMSLYGHVIDARAWDRVHEVVTDDAEFDSSALGPGGGGSRAGLENVVAFWRTAPHPPAHHFANAYIYEEDGEVRSLSKWFIADGHGGIFGGDYQDGVLTAYCLLDDVAHLELNGHILIPLQNIASLHCSSRCDAPEPDWPPRGLDEDEQPEEG